MHKENFINEYMQVQQASIRPSIIISAFKKSGTWPIDRTVFNDDDYAPSIPYSTEAQDFPSHPLDPNDSGSESSDLESDSDHDTNTESHHPVSSHCPSQPIPQSSSSLLPAADDITSPGSPSPTSSPVVSASLSCPVTPGPMQYSHNPVLFDCICELEKQVQLLLGHVKMVELELQNEKWKSNQWNGRASKQ
jgi:hypothetical protein